jgi:triosephosphate isomerase (TIM)
MRKKIVVGNWKMNLLAGDAGERAKELGALVGQTSEVEVGICPTFLSIASVHDALDGSPVGVGAQDVFWKESGAFTGFLSASMLRDAGVKFVLIGHSERRGKFGKIEVPETTVAFFAESDETVNLKLKAVLDAGLTPIVCCGETLAEREAGNTDRIIQTQINGALAGFEATQLDSLVVAYEPVWAIGTGKVCDSSEANRVCRMIRACLPAAIANTTRIQYGGSVNPSNAEELFSQSDIDGGLVGGASLKPSDFIQVIQAALGK